MRTIIIAVVFLLASFGVFAQNVVMEVSGTVELMFPGASEFVPARAGIEIVKETIVSTGFRSSALIKVESTLITVRPLTRMTLSEIASQAGTETLNVNLQAGRVRMDVNPPAGTKVSATVSSTVATASVRGTSFEFDTRNLYVYEGTVSFSGSQGLPVLVSSGSSSYAGEGGGVSDPIGDQISELTPTPPPGTGAATGGDDTDDSLLSSGVNFDITINWQ